MLKINKLTVFCIFLTVAAVLDSGCVSIPEGEPPAEVVTIQPTLEKSEPVALAEAVNLAATELAVNVFPQKGVIKLLFKNNPAADAVTRKLYAELKMFLPVKSVLRDEHFVIESSFRTDSVKRKIWQLRLKDKKNKIIYAEAFVIKNEVLK